MSNKRPKGSFIKTFKARLPLPEAWSRIGTLWVANAIRSILKGEIWRSRDTSKWKI